MSKIAGFIGVAMLFGGLAVVGSGGKGGSSEKTHIGSHKNAAVAERNCSEILFPKYAEMFGQDVTPILWHQNFEMGEFSFRYRVKGEYVLTGAKVTITSMCLTDASGKPTWVTFNGKDVI